MRLKLALVIALSLLMGTLVLLHVRGVNGPWYWIWSWRRLSWWLYPAMLAAAVPFALAQRLHARRPAKIRPALILLGCATILLQLTALAFQPPVGLQRLIAIVVSPTNTSYYTDAVVLSEQDNIPVTDWMYLYSDVIPILHLHAKYKPPGLVLYYFVLVEIFGRGAVAAAVGGLVIALIAAAAPLTTFLLTRFYSADDDAAFCAASYMSLCPSLILFLPQFDQVYATLSAVVLTVFGVMVMRGSLRAAIGLGALLSLALFMSYIFLIFGLFMTAWWMLMFIRPGPTGAFRAMVLGGVVVCTIIVLYGLLWVMTGFDPIATYQSIARAQARDLIPLMRPFPQHIIFDVYDFALGAGWVAFVLVAFLLVRLGRSVFAADQRHRFILVALMQIIVVALAALLPGETARLWLPMMPLLMALAGLELTYWPQRYRWGVYACVWLMLVAIGQNMTFIYMGPELDGPRW